MQSFKFNLDFIPLPFRFIDSILTETNGAYIRIYLYALSLAIKGEKADLAHIAGRLNLLESDVMNAFSYWERMEMLRTDAEGNIVFNDAPVQEHTDGDEIYSENTHISEQNTKPKKTAEAIQKIIEEDKELADLCMVSQELMGRTLNTKEIETIYWFYDALGLAPDVIACLLEYCVSINKTNINYIEKVAIGWAENGINTLEKASVFIENESKKKSILYAVKQALRIKDRELIEREEKYALDWMQKLGMSVEMISLAYEYCIMRTGKLALPYMDSIIKNWHKKGIFTVEEAQKDQENFKAKNKKFEQKNTSIFESSNYDSNTIEDLMRNKYR